MYCYATQNARMDLENKEYQEKLKNWLNFYWECIDTNPYVDPDMLVKGKKVRINPCFYEDLRTFLNNQNGRKYKYTAEDEYINDETGINLISDQFGFSAPKINPTHPYDVYFQKCKQEGRDKDLAIENVVRWVMTSRTIGGSFLWPKELWQTYNMRRGGSTTYKGGSYIQDRVDLTLLEIKHYLDNNGNVEGDVLKVEDNSNSQKWLLEFASFQNYVNYFCLQPFVDESNNYMPYDIVRSDMEKPNGGFVCIDDDTLQQAKMAKNYFANNSIFNLDSLSLEKMLNNVSLMIMKRTQIMEDIINSKK